MSATPPSPTSAKICGLCGQDCSNKPRIKDNAGNYFCKACMESKQAAKPAPAAAPRPATPRALAPASASGGGYDIFADNVIGSKKIAGPSKLCVSCNTPMKEDSVVCVNCGYNQQSGKGLKTKVVIEKDPSKAAQVAGAATKGSALLVIWTVMALLGGGVGMGIMIGVMIATDFYIGWLNILVGMFAGGAVALTGARRLNFFSGLIASGVTLAYLGLFIFVIMNAVQEGATLGAGKILIMSIVASLIAVVSAYRLGTGGND